MSISKMESIQDLTRRLNEVEQTGIKQIIDGIDVETRFSTIPRQDGNQCHMSVKLKVQNVNPSCSLFVRDALENSKLFVVESIGAEGKVVSATYDNRLSENYVNNKELQGNAEKNIGYQLNKILERELSRLQDSVHNYEFKDNKGAFSKTKSTGNKSGILDRMFSKLKRASEHAGLGA